MCFALVVARNCQRTTSKTIKAFDPLRSRPDDIHWNERDVAFHWSLKTYAAGAVVHMFGALLPF